MKIAKLAVVNLLFLGISFAFIHAWAVSSVPVQESTAASIAAPPANFSVDRKDLPEYVMAIEPETHHMLPLLAGRSKQISLDAQAVKAVVDKPSDLSVFIVDPKTINVLAHKTSGIVHFTVTDKNGQIIMARYIAILPNLVEKYVRTKHVCPEQSTQERSCGKTIYYFCHNECYETRIAFEDAPIVNNKSAP